MEPSQELLDLLDKARDMKLSPADVEAQRQSWATQTRGPRQARGEAANAVICDDVLEPSE